MNRTIIEKEFLVVVFKFENFRPYHVGSHVISLTDHATLKGHFKESDTKPSLIQWIILLQEFDCEINDRKGFENTLEDYLSWIVIDDLCECLPDKQLFGALVD